MANFPSTPAKVPVPSLVSGTTSGFPLPPAFGPRQVSFTQAMDPGSLTIDELMSRQKELAVRQANLSQGDYPGQGTILGGLGNVLNQFTTSFGRARAAGQEAAGRQQLADALSRINMTTGELSQPDMATVWQRDPDIALELMEQAMTLRQKAATQEHWEPIPTPEGETGQWFKNSVTGQEQKVGGASGTKGDSTME